MQTIEEYKEYTKKLEGEVGDWHDAYEASLVERDQLVRNMKKLECENAKLAVKNKLLEKSLSDHIERLQDLLNELEKQNQGENQNENPISRRERNFK